MYEAERQLVPGWLYVPLTGEAARTSRMFFFYRWADTRIQIYNEDGSVNRPKLRDAIIDASGPAAAVWSDPDGIAELQFLAPGADPDYGERVWLNRVKRRTEVAFDVEAFRRASAKWLAEHPGYRIPKKALIALGFDGSRGSVDPKRSPDHTGLVATEIETGFQQKFGHWDPSRFEGRMIPRDQVDIAVDDAFTNYTVIRMYADPPDWDPEIAAWRAKYGIDKVIEWFTWRERPAAFAIANYAQAIELGQVPNDGDVEFTAHIGHAHKRWVNARDGQGKRLFVIQKEREGSQLKIDLGMAGTLSWEARTDSIAAGALAVAKPAGPYFIRTN